MQRSISTFAIGMALGFAIFGTAKAWTPSPDMAETIAQERYAASHDVEFFNPVPDGADYYPPED